MANQNLLPEIRFSDFDSPIQEGQLVDVLEDMVDCEHKTAPYVENSEYKVVRTTDVKNGKLLEHQLLSTTEEGFKEWTKRAVPIYGQILFTREAPAGESALVPFNTNICLGQRMVLLRPNETKCSGKYLAQYLQSPIAKKAINRFIIGSTVTRINMEDISKVRITISSVLEQQKIASFLTAVDKRIKLLEEKKEQLDRYKQGVMQKIFSQEIRFKDENGNDFPDWVEKRFDQLYEFKPTNSFSRDKLNYSVGEVKNIHYGDIHTKFNSHFNLVQEDLPYVNSEVDLNRIDVENYAKEGDLVIADASEDYEDIGKSIELINLNGEKVLAGLHTFLARLINNQAEVGFMGHLMKSYSMRQSIMKIAQGTKVLGISTTRLAKVEFKVPLKAEQRKIADFLTDLDSAILKVDNQKTETEKFKKGLLQKMFV